MLAAAAASLLLPLGVHVATASAAGTVVTLTFDDGRESQFSQARPILDAHGMKGTFFIISASLDGDARSMTLQQVRTLAAEGHEIGGHTVLHHDLTAETLDEDEREICNDRTWLLQKGFQVYDLAYPYNAVDGHVETAARHCGYNAARAGGELVSALDCTLSGRCAETIPPRDPFAVRAPLSEEEGMTVADLENQVMTVEQTGGGWVSLNFHDVCDDCPGPYRVSPAELDALLDWLAPRAAAGTVVRTMHDVIGGPLLAAVAGPKPPKPAPLGTNLLQNPSLEDAAPASHDEPRAARCFTEHNDTPTTPAVWERTSDAHSGAAAVRVSVSAIDDWGFWALVPTLDLGGCAPVALPGHVYEVSGWYKATAPVTLIGYDRDAASYWQQLDHSGTFPASPTWRRASFVLPPMPANASGLSAGFWFNQVGTLTMDDLSIVDVTPPTKTLKLRMRGNGTGRVVSTPAALDCRASCSAQAPAGAAVTLRVTPDPGTVFRGWGGACSGTAPTCTVQMTANVAVTVKLGRA